MLEEREVKAMERITDVVEAWWKTQRRGYIAGWVMATLMTVALVTLVGFVIFGGVLDTQELRYDAQAFDVVDAAGVEHGYVCITSTQDDPAIWCEKAE